MTSIPARARLGELLVEAGLIEQDKIDEALAHLEAVEGRPMRLGAYLVQLGAVTEGDVARACARQLSLPYMDLRRSHPDFSLASLVPKRWALRNLVVPVSIEDGVLTIAMVDPANVFAVDDLRAVTAHKEMRRVVSTQTAVIELISRLYELNGNVEGGGADVIDELEADDDELEDSLREEIESAPIVQLVQNLFSDAIRLGATDIHVEPYPDNLRVRFRVDGALRENAMLPKWVKRPAISRIKVMAGMDIAEHRRPQDGRGRFSLGSDSLDMRISTVPTVWGEKAVIRLLPKGERALTLDRLGLSDRQKTSIEKHLAAHQGLIIFTGPTGSGKTTSMYAALSELASVDRNMVTLEDPVEYEMLGTSQIEVDEKIGLTFARGLRSVLRQDPDVIMVGEIRDAETARITMQASMTGHLVLTTLHTNDAPSVLTRLSDIGIEQFLVASSLSLVVAQRLLRTVCSHCREADEPSDWTLGLLGLSPKDLAKHNIVRGRGCEECGYTGYRGRIGIFEVLSVSRKIREMISSGASAAVVTVAAQAEGMKTLQQAAVEKALEGVTSLEEVIRLTRFDRDDLERCSACGREVEASYVKCPYCSHNLAGEVCRSCKSRVDPEWVSCPFCGLGLPETAFSPGGETPVAEVFLPPGTNNVSDEDGSPQAVLVIENDANTGALIEQMLTPKYSVTLVETGEDAMAIAERDLPDLVIMSIALPETPCAVLQRMEENPGMAAIPVVLLTKPGYEDQEPSCLDFKGVKDLFSKPIRADELQARVAGTLRRSLSAQVMQGQAPSH